MGAVETGPAGYSASDWVCVGGSQQGSNITVGIGGEATCTITNDDIGPKLHLRKVVVNDNGGTKTVANFTLTADGAGSNDLSGTGPVDSGAGLQADTWALSETNVYGYTASAWSCVGGTKNWSNITVGIGGEATCTITNNDQPGTIIIKKITKPANQGSFGFTTTGTGYNPFTLPGGDQNSQTLNAGTYTATEGTQLGWILTGIGFDPPLADPTACQVTGQGGSTGNGNLNTMTATINLKNGDTVTCVFENTGQGVTRTQGFWATHTPLAEIAWFGGTKFGHTFPGVAATQGIGDKTLCNPVTKDIDTLGKLMGGFWSGISKTSTNKARSSLDQARMQLLQQLLAAELNARPSAAFRPAAQGSSPSGRPRTAARTRRRSRTPCRGPRPSTTRATAPSSRRGRRPTARTRERSRISRTGTSCRNDGRGRIIGRSLSVSIGVPAASTLLVTAKVAAGQKVAGLLNQDFVQVVTCLRACDVTTIVSISLSDAKKLGFKGSTPRVVVASSFERVKANTRTKVVFVATPQGKKLLPGAKSSLRVRGQVTAIARTNRAVHANTSWNTLLR